MTTLTDFQLMILEKEHITCADVMELLGDYEDRELTPTLRGRLDAHIQTCADCQELKSSYHTTLELAKELPQRPLTKDIQNRLRSALNERLGLNLTMVD